MPKKSSTSHHQPTIMLIVSYLVLFVVTFVVIYLANQLFPQQIVLGTLHITPVWALIHSCVALSLLNTFAIPFFHGVEHRRGTKLTDKEWMVGYFILNFVGIWVVTRFADNLGFGISSWLVATGLALALDMAQGMAMMGMEKMRTK